MRVRFPTQQQLAGKTKPVLELRCDIDCAYSVTVELVGARTTGASAAPSRPPAPLEPAASGTAVGRTTAKVRLALPKQLAAGRYRLLVTLTAPVNTGRPAVVRGGNFRIP